MEEWSTDHTSECKGKMRIRGTDGVYCLQILVHGSEREDVTNLTQVNQH